MRKIILYCMLLGAALLLPIQGNDVGKLLPVELVQLYREGDTFVITTDAGAEGTGRTIREAIGNMKETTPGIVFLDTADFLLIRDINNEETELLKEYLKGSVRFCSQEGEIDPKEACALLRVHKPKLRLKDRTPGTEAEVLKEENGRMMLK